MGGVSGNSKCEICLRWQKKRPENIVLSGRLVSVGGLVEGEGEFGEAFAVGTGHYAELAGLGNEVEVVVVEFEGFGCYAEVHCSAFAGGEAYALEMLQLFHGARHRACHVADIELHYFVAAAVAAVAHCHRCSDSAVFAESVLVEFEVAVFKVGVA